MNNQQTDSANSVRQERSVRPRSRVASARRQRGMGMTGLMLTGSVAIFIGLFAFKVGPQYFENWTVVQVAESVAADSELMKKPRSAVYQQLNKQYRSNNLWDLKAEDTITLAKDGKRGYILTVKYEKRANLFSNIDLVTSFDKVAGPS